MVINDDEWWFMMMNLLEWASGNQNKAVNSANEMEVCSWENHRAKWRIFQQDVWLPRGRNNLKTWSWWLLFAEFVLQRKDVVTRKQPSLCQFMPEIVVSSRRKIHLLLYSCFSKNVSLEILEIPKIPQTILTQPCKLSNEYWAVGHTYMFAQFVSSSNK